MSTGFPHLGAQDWTAAYCVVVLAAWLWSLRPRRAAPPKLTPAQRHAGNIERSRRIARRARREGPSLEALRAVTAHEFEEVVLTALEHRGHRITRSERYTGDGGWDGEVRVRRLFGSQRFLVQSKRYARAIRAEHIDDFKRVCRTERCRGLFVHTGTMGPTSEAADARARRVVVVHGAALERLVAGRRVRVGGVRL